VKHDTAQEYLVAPTSRSSQSKKKSRRKKTRQRARDIGVGVIPFQLEGGELKGGGAGETEGGGTLR